MSRSTGAGRAGVTRRVTVGEALAEAERRFEERDVEFPDASALWLMAKVLDELEDPDALEEAPDRPVPREAAERFWALVERREAHEPYGYLVGACDFRGRLMEVEHGVFLPRLQSERMCDELEAWVEDLGRSMSGCRIADLGTGCGAIAVSLALGPLEPAWVTAVDLSVQALEVTRRNATRHGVADRVRPVAGDWLSWTPPEPVFDVITAVPPYLNPGDEEWLTEESLEWEPMSSFFGEPSGDKTLIHVIDAAAARLVDGGLFACQIDVDQAPMVEAWVNEDPDHPLSIEWILQDEDEQAEAILAVKG